MTIPTRDELLERILKSVQVLPTGCWIWLGPGDTDGGYGRISIGGRQALAHRVAYELLVGPIPEGKQIDHLCRVRRCVNPAHLEPVSLRENVLRGIGLTAQNKRKTHCVSGHEFSGSNLAVIDDGQHRRCRRCANDTMARYRVRMKKNLPVPKFSIGQTVTWTSQANGRSREKTGTVVEVVAPRQHPKTRGVDISGSERSSESYVVRTERRSYWPRVSALRLAEVQ